MAFTTVAWAFKDIITSAKLAAMVENIRAHDHRADGSQGSAFYRSGSVGVNFAITSGVGRITFGTPFAAGGTLTAVATFAGTSAQGVTWRVAVTGVDSTGIDLIVVNNTGGGPGSAQTYTVNYHATKAQP